ncbi:unnamed protein product [Lepidochelys olivacea]
MAPMASMLGLPLLFAVATALAGQDLVPTRCLQGPKFWCQDVATAVTCQREQYCTSLWAAVPLWDQLEEEDEARPPAKKCTFCTQIVDKLKSLAGDDPDDDAISKALNSVCRAVGRRQARMCKLLLKKYKDQLTDGLQNGDEAGDICTSIKWCKEPPVLELMPAAFPEAMPIPQSFSLLLLMIVPTCTAQNWLHGAWHGASWDCCRPEQITRGQRLCQPLAISLALAVWHLFCWISWAGC